jgi:hypothetical protein
LLHLSLQKLSACFLLALVCADLRIIRVAGTHTTMGASQAGNFEVPSAQHTATLYYFEGRGLADQIRWMMAATNVEFTQKVLKKRTKFLEMAGRQLPFGQLPLLQIDGMEIVQSQAAVRYLAKRAGLQGKSPADELKCDMISEAVRDILPLLLAAPFRKYSATGAVPARNEKEWAAHSKLAKEKWGFIGSRLEVLRTKAKISATAGTENPCDCFT